MSSAIDQNRRIYPTAVQRPFAEFPALVTYSPQELSALWLQGDRYRAQQWPEQWIAYLPSERVHSGPSAIRLTSA